MARRVVEAEAADVDEVSIVVGDDELLADLNTQFRGKQRPTDVLSFPMGRIGDYFNLGEVVISSDRAVVQARRYGHSVSAEMARLLVHGLLHLIGYSHGSTATRRRMRSREAEHLKRLRPWVQKLDRRYRSVEP